MLVKNSLKKLILGSVVILLFGLIFSSAGFILADNATTTAMVVSTVDNSTSGGASDALIQDLNSQIDVQRKKIDGMVGQIDQLNNSITSAQNKGATLGNQVLILNNQIAKMELDIESKNSEIKATELEVAKILLEIKDNEVSIAKDKDQLAAFIRQLNVDDQKTYLAVLLSNNSFSEFFDQIKYLENVSNDVQNTLNRVQESVARLDSQKAELEAKRNSLSQLLAKLEEEKGAMDDQKGEKQFLITETKNSEKKFQSLVGNMKAEQSAANNQVAALERKLRDELAKKGSKEKFNSLADAALGWPISTHRITATFHDPDYPYRNLFEHSGLDMGAKQGTPVMAAEGGYVATVGLMTKWYGNYIMIIHSNNLATLYGHLSSVAVAKDQYVSKGQIIGLSGNTGFSSGPHLHFEVRYNGIPVNPLSYLP